MKKFIKWLKMNWGVSVTLIAALLSEIAPKFVANVFLVELVKYVFITAIIIAVLQIGFGYTVFMGKKVKKDE